jgi:hypothetical protein
VDDDDLHYAEGGIDEAGKPRVSVLLGRGATFRGIANAIAGVVNSATGGTVTRTITAEEIAAALLVYNQSYLGLDPETGQAGMEPFLTNWRVGLRLPLPLEIDTTATRWVTNRVSILEAEPPGLWDQLIDLEPEPLPIPDPVELAQVVSGWLASRSIHTSRSSSPSRHSGSCRQPERLCWYGRR